MLYIFNTTIVPNEGLFVNQKISILEVQHLLDSYRKSSDSEFQGEVQFTSAIGHQGSADVFNCLFPELQVEVNRMQAILQPGDQAICLKLKGRLPEGAILTMEELEEVGYEFYLLTNLGFVTNELGMYNSNLGYISPVEKYIHGR